MSLKTYKQIPIHIVENHNEVLPHIYKSMGAKYLPIHNNTLIHFDSHPDMLIPQNLNADDVIDKYELFNQISIENWIMPAVYSGHFNKLIWIKQNFCNQIENGKYIFHIGKCKKTNLIKITAKNSYFLSEVLYSPIEDLDNIKQVELIVLTFDENTNNSIEEIAKQMNLENDNYVLDIDLDYFSTRNPFLDLYKLANLYERLKKIYKCEIPNTDNEKEIEIFIEKRKIQLENLKWFFNNIGKENEIREKNIQNKFSSDIFNELNELVSEVNKYYTIIEWDLIHEAGCTCDEINRSLPHYIINKNKLIPLIDLTFNNWFNIIKNCKLPILITISRSSEDDYCPSEYVDQIENHVVNILNREYNCQVYFNYLEDSNDE